MIGFPATKTAIIAAGREVMAKFPDAIPHGDFSLNHAEQPVQYMPVQVESHASACSCGTCLSVSVWIYHEPSDTVIESERYNICPNCYHLPRDWK